MEYKRPKIELYRVRTFSEKISDTFDFLRQTWRPMLKFFCYLMLPVSIVMAFFTNNFMSSYFSMLGNANAEGLASMGLTMIGTGIISCIMAVLIVALVFSMVRLYQRRDDQLSGLTFEELKAELKSCVGRAVRLMLASLLLGVLVGVLAGLVIVAFTAVSPFLGVAGVFLTYMLLLVVMVPMSLVVPIYMYEDDIVFIEALQKAWRLGFATWGGVFAVGFVLMLIISALYTLTFLPWYFMVMLKGILALERDGAGFAATGGYSLLQYLACIWMCLGYGLASIILFVGFTIQYGHASDKIDGTSVADKIDKFDELDKF